MPQSTDYTREAQKIWKALQPMVEREVHRQTNSCVRAKKMMVVTPPDGKLVGVAEPYGQTVFVPYSSALTLVPGDAVWVYWYFGNASTMIVIAKGDGQLVASSIANSPFADELISFANLKAHADTVDALSLFVNYNDIASFTLTPAAIEIGNATASVTLAWTFYATPASLTLNGVSKSVSSSGETVTATDDGSTHQVTYTLATSIGSKTEAFHFYPNLYWGVSSTAGSPTSAFVIGLASKQLSGSKAKTFTVNAGSGQYIYFCSPVRYGQCAFKSGGFEGGFEAAQTVSVTNASGHTENYYVYRSTNPGLGSTTITVS